MKFTDKFNLVLRVLNCTNAGIAKTAGIDPSTISRFRSGTRIPSPESKHLILCCKGIIRYAKEHNLLEELLQECGLPNHENLPDELLLYFIEETEKQQYNSKKHDQITWSFFSDKLNILMNMYGISNIRLARALNVDSSLISRFRNSHRTPLKSNIIMDSLCNYFYRIAKQSEREQELSDIIGESISTFQNHDRFINKFKEWFFDKSGRYTSGSIDNFLDKLGDLTLTKIPQLPPLNNIITEEVTKDNSKEYFGLAGFRRAIIKFLSTVVMSDSPKTLKLYSDQNMNWLTTDVEFLQKWASLMSSVLSRRIPIKIIHNITRDIDEMLVGIEKWLPLYMSGTIEGFYRKSHSDPWFSHTLFVAPEIAAISASVATGTESFGIYNYCDSFEQISYYENQIDTLFQSVKSLIKVFKRNNLSEYMLFTGELSKAQGSLKKLSSLLSFATIPSDLLIKILIRSGVEKEKIDSIIAVHSDFVRQFERELKDGTVKEYIALPSVEQVLAGKVYLDLSDLFINTEIFYLPEEFSLHIKHLITLLDDDNYNFIPINKSPYSNIQICVKEGTGAIVKKTDNPTTVFWFSHPLMCSALCEYIEVVGQNNCFLTSEKGEIIKMLNDFIASIDNH